MHNARLGFSLAVAALAVAASRTPAHAQQALVSDNPGYCLATNGTLTRCTDQQNVFTRTYEARNAFVFRAAGGCLDGSAGQSNPVRVAACNGGLAQDWYVVDDKLIQNKANNLCLDVKDENFSEGNPVILWGCVSKRNQRNQNFALAPIRQAGPGEKAKSLPSIRQAGVSNGAISGQTVYDIGGGYVIAAGGYNLKTNPHGKVVGAGGGNVIAAGGANVIAAGGANVIAAGGANATSGSTTTTGVIAAGGANATSPASGGVIAAGGANVIAAGGANAVPTTTANVIGAGGGNVIAAGGANVIAAGGANYSTLSTGGTAASSGQFSVSGKSNIFAAARSAVPDVYYGGGELPPEIAVAGLKYVTFPSVTGGVGYSGYQGGGHPDGITDGNYPRTNIDAYQGISGVVHDNRIMFLVGVFVEDAEPRDPAPTSLNLTDANSDNIIAPGMRQVFFIGDGQTATGQPQRFMVPSGATRLFLGFADSMGFTGSHATYGDNDGAISVSFQTYK